MNLFERLQKHFSNNKNGKDTDTESSFRNPNGQNPSVLHFLLSENHCTAENTCLEGTVTEQETVLEEFLSNTVWEGSEEKEIRKSLGKKTGNAELSEQINRLFSDCRIADWNGFQGTNPDVMDGSSMTFSAAFADGTGVFASGTNHFPKHYREFKDGLRELMK